jgi:hypothetical protein
MNLIVNLDDDKMEHCLEEIGDINNLLRIADKKFIERFFN